MEAFLEPLILLGGMAVVGLLVWQGYALRIMPVPTGRKTREAALRLLETAGAAPARIVELGAGWGGMTRLLARRWPDAQVTAYERSLLPYLAGALTGRGRATVLRGDLFGADLRGVDVVFCYLSPWHMERLAPKFERELAPGAWVVSVSFPLPGREPAAQETVTGLTPIAVRLYRY